MRSKFFLATIGLAIGLGGCGGGGNAAPDAAVNDSDAGADAGVPLETCRDGWCWMYPTPQGNDLVAVSGFSATDVWAVGRRGAIVHFDGNEWTELVPPASSTRDLFRLYGGAPNDLWAGGDGALYHWNGTAWTDAGLRSISALGGGGTNNVWLAEPNGVSQWDGSVWIPRPNPQVSGRLLGFWSSGGSIYTVSSGAGIAKWLVGSGWGIVDGGNHNGNAAAFVSSTQIVLAADNGVVWFYDGNGWTSKTTPQTTSWTSIAAVSLTDVWVSNGRQAAHWNGTQWTQAATGASGFASAAGLWLDPTGAPWLSTNLAEVFTWSGSVWTQRTVGKPDIVNVGGTADDDVWVTTLGAGTRHWNGASWTDVANPAQAASCVPRDLWAAATDDVWVALACRATGSNDMAPRRLMHWNGSTWSLVESLGFELAPITNQGFNAVWGSAASNVYAVADTALYHFNGSAWSEVMNGPPGGNQIFGIGQDDLYVVHAGALWHWNGLQWSSRSPPVATVSGLQTAADGVWLGGDISGNNGAFFDGQLFVTTTFIGQPAGIAADVFVQERSDDGTRVEARYKGGLGGTRTATPAFFDQNDAWRSPSGKTYVAGGAAGGGLVVHGP